MDLIAARYVQLNKNTSDNIPALYGGYLNYKLAEKMDIDYYFFFS